MPQRFRQQAYRHCGVCSNFFVDARKKSSVLPFREALCRRPLFFEVFATGAGRAAPQQKKKIAAFQEIIKLKKRKKKKPPICHPQAEPQRIFQIRPRGGHQLQML